MPGTAQICPLVDRLVPSTMGRWLILLGLLTCSVARGDGPASGGPASGEPPRRRLLVLDPGHGGSNLGAHGPRIKRHEKALTLDLARRVVRFLAQWRPDIEVLLTRERDTYLTLDQRVRKANGVHAALFVSLHFNASATRSQKGFETFILTREASEHEAARLSMRSRQRGGSVVGAILSDLHQSAAHGESAQLARRIQHHLARARGADLDRGVRQAPFDVLLGLRMPGVLVEVGFIDHPTEGPELARGAQLEAVAVALAAALGEQLP